MGYQESFIRFADTETLKAELERYLARDTKGDLAGLASIDRVKKALAPFEQNEFVMVIVGERSEQRSATDLFMGLGIENVTGIKYIDDYWAEANGDLGPFLDDHFQQLTVKEFQTLCGE